MTKCCWHSKVYRHITLDIQASSAMLDMWREQTKSGWFERKHHIDVYRFCTSTSSEMVHEWVSKQNVEKYNGNSFNFLLWKLPVVLKCFDTRVSVVMNNQKKRKEIQCLTWNSKKLVFLSIDREWKKKTLIEKDRATYSNSQNIRWGWPWILPSTQHMHINNIIEYEWVLKTYTGWLVEKHFIPPPN